MARSANQVGCKGGRCGRAGCTAGIMRSRDGSGIAGLSEQNCDQGMAPMKGITVKLPESTLRQLRQRARRSGGSVSAVIRELLEREPPEEETVYTLVADLVGSQHGSARGATNERRKFRR